MAIFALSPRPSASASLSLAQKRAISQTARSLSSRGTSRHSARSSGGASRGTCGPRAGSPSFQLLQVPEVHGPPKGSLEGLEVFGVDHVDLDPFHLVLQGPDEGLVKGGVSRITRSMRLGA